MNKCCVIFDIWKWVLMTVTGSIILFIENVLFYSLIGIRNMEIGSSLLLVSGNVNRVVVNGYGFSLLIKYGIKHIYNKQL